MKLNKAILFGAASLFMLTSCNDWLDVNDSPNSPTDAAAPYDKRLAHIEFYTNHAYWFGGQPSTMIVGDMTYTTRTASYGQFAQWQMNSGRSTTCYQWFYVGAASNIYPMINDAIANQAWHYAGAGYLILAQGMGQMMDQHGELPCYDALGENVTPTYPTGREMYRFVMENIDKAIEYLSMEQPGGTVSPLSANDYWAHGDVTKWRKYAQLLKARYLLRLSKKEKGTFSLENDKLVYDPALILDCLNKSFGSVDENMTVDYQDVAWTTNDVLGWSEPVNYNPLYSVIGMNSGYFFTKTMFDRLTNFDNKGIEDPRADRILPWARSTKSANSPEEMYGQKIKWSEDGKWRRTIGLDMQSTLRTEAAPYNTVYGKVRWVNGQKETTETSQFYCDNEKRAGDTIFVQQRCGGKGYYQGKDLLIYLDNLKGSGSEMSAQSGTFFTRPDAPGFLGTYHEVCFIKAEVLFNNGDKAGAYTAYKAGVKAHMQAMNKKLNAWVAGDPNLTRCPSFVPMTDAEINNYCDKALGTSADISLAKIMTQKMLAMQYSLEQWVDMRRYDYNPKVFMNWGVPAEYFVNSGSQNNIPGVSKDGGQGPRRWVVSTHESNYNRANLNAVGKGLVRDGAKWSEASPEWWNELDMWIIPVWWDTKHLD